jgi:hypothetical protein
MQRTLKLLLKAEQEGVIRAVIRVRGVREALMGLRASGGGVGTCNGWGCIRCEHGAGGPREIRSQWAAGCPRPHDVRESGPLLHTVG